MATTPRLYTVEDLPQLPALPNDGSYELVRGELREVSPAGWRDSRIEVRLLLALGAYVTAHGLGEVTSGQGGYLLETGPDTMRAPDVGFIRAERVRAAEGLEGFVPGAPDLAVEVISPTNRRGEAEERIANFLEAGTRLVWLIHPKKRTVSVFAPGREPRPLAENDVLDGEDVVPGFRYELAKLWV